MGRRFKTTPLHVKVSLGKLFDDLRNRAGADGAAAFADRETHLLFQSGWRDKFHSHVDVVARHDHLDTLWQRDVARDVGRADVELGTIAREERGVTTTFLL